MTSPRYIQQSFRHARHAPALEIRSTFKSTQSYKAHSHESISLGLILDGETDLNLNGNDHRLVKGDMVIIGAGVVHACAPVQGRPRSYHMLYIDQEYCRSLVPHLSLDHYYILAHKRLFAEICRMLDENKDLDATIIGTILEHCNTKTHRSPARPNLCHNIKKHLDDHLASPPSLLDLAKNYQSTPETIIRQFKKTFGITPKAYINNARIEWGKRLLKDGTDIADCAVQVGFSDQSAFHHAFVQFTAATPRQYQKSIFDNKS